MRDIIAELKAEKAELDLKKSKLFDYLHSVECAEEVSNEHKDLLHNQLTSMVDYSIALRDRLMDLVPITIDGIDAKGQTYMDFEQEKLKKPLAGVVQDGYISNGETWFDIDSAGGRALMRQYHL